jgi:hypothetical protein
MNYQQLPRRHLFLETWCLSSPSRGKLNFRSCILPSGTQPLRHLIHKQSFGFITIAFWATQAYLHVPFYQDT